jgi:hypothetical protein
MTGARPFLYQEIRCWLISLLLVIPACIPYGSHFLRSDQTLPTGFIQGDQQQYMAYAREHFDDGEFSLTYGYPFSASYETPKIYFQPQTLALGVLWKLTGWSPGIVYVLFGLFSIWTCARIALALYVDVVGLTLASHWLGLVVFFWGGGLLAAGGAGVSTYFAFHGGTIDAHGIFQFDPMLGWWFLNFGRNLILPTEAFYHALFFACILCIRKRKFAWGVGVALLCSLCHPFTGTELIAILVCWSFVEMFTGRNRYAPRWFFAACAFILILHVSYYVGYLSQFPEHLSTISRWNQPWYLRWETIILAYFLVGVLAVWTLRNVSAVHLFFPDGKARLFFAWFVVAFLLANHELFVRPMQPLHFTRGYIWTSLFFIGVPSLITLFEHVRKSGASKGRFITTMIVSLFLSDNAAWLTVVSTSAQPIGIRLTADQQELLTWMNTHENVKALLLCQDDLINDLSTVYTPMRSWRAHRIITPESEARNKELTAFFSGGQSVDEWYSRRLIIVFGKNSALPLSGDQFCKRYLPDRTIERRYENSSYIAFAVAPGSPEARHD